MDNDDGIIFGAGERRSRDPSLLLSPACSRVSRHQHGRLAAASGGTSSSWTTTMASSSGPGGGGLATPPSWSAPRLRASGVIITGVRLLRVAALRRHGQRQRYHLRCRGAAVSRPLPAAQPHVLTRRASSSRASGGCEWRDLVVMDNDDGIISGAGGRWSRDPSLAVNPTLACNGIVFGAGGRRSHDPSLLVCPTLACIGLHHDGRLAAASGGASWS